MGVHWHTRTNLSVIVGGTSANKRQEGEHAALAAVLRHSIVLLQVAGAELATAANKRSGEYESAIMDEDEQLSGSISSVLRRLLPSLRIASKWLKLNIDYLIRLSTTTELIDVSCHMFSEHYGIFFEYLFDLFPINQLPSITGPLEEDLDLRGFAPISRGLTPFGGNRPDDRFPSAQTDDEDEIQVGPDEEQLMRISDLQVEARLISQGAVRADLILLFRSWGKH